MLTEPFSPRRRRRRHGPIDWEVLGIKSLIVVVYAAVAAALTWLLLN